ncbi:MAG: glutamine synthetase III [Elusimicrobia bacterium]|nr:glutamine synthetase III [Elusimicrobiota bacterium]
MEHDKKDSAKTAMDRFGSLTFNKAAMARFLSKAVYEKLLSVIERGETLDPEITDEVAHGMKEWALGQGATHFTHWFQPMRGETAEKHDTFLSLDAEGNPIVRFSGRQLIQGEPDASSFPSGGMRSTFEARGYTAWDPTSPAFLLKNGNAATLVVPSVFLSWTGEALDMKMPLLRSLRAVEDRALKLIKLFGNRTARHVRMSVGPEQEYFLVTKEYANTRPDLLCAGRTLFGAASAKHQQMEDHYFGSIKPKVMSFMSDLDSALFERGIPSKTRHNEVAPNQFELAPLYEEANLAIDHNVQAMEIMRRVADEHGLTILFHEKPFLGINGSGKHLNWSLMDSDGNNVFEPGAAPKKNILFLTFTAALMAGVDKFGALLRASVADAGNDHRLGANEAPPAIMSVYLGEHLSGLIDRIVKGGKDDTEVRNAIDHGLRRLPTVARDASDRNRTSPIAFTGNKFEFRAVGASQNTSEAAAAWGVIMAYGIDRILEKLEKAKGADITDKALTVVREVFKETARVRFEGNGYSVEWHKEAAKRGLPNAKNTPAALEILSDKAVVELYETYKVLNKAELAAKKEIRLETYAKTKEIELKLLKDMAQTGVIPALTRQIAEFGTAREALASAKAGTKALEGRLQALGDVLSGLYAGVDAVDAVLEKVHSLDAHHKAEVLAERGVAALDGLRAACDEAEVVVDNRQWPYPKYREMLFLL